MVSEMKLFISENDKVIHSLVKEINTQSFVKSLEEFQHVVNAKLTEMIEEGSGSGDENMEDESDSCDDDEEDASVLPKKRKQ